MERPSETRCSGCRQTPAGADVEQLLERRERTFDLAGLEQVVGGCDVQDDRVVAAVLGMGGDDIWVFRTFEVLGDPREDSVWRQLAAEMARNYGGLPVSIVGVDAGFLTSHVQRQCGRRRWWCAVVSRSGDGKPIARRPGPTGICTAGKDESAALWVGKLSAGRVHLPLTMGRRELTELAAAESLTVRAGRLKWEPIPGRQNHRWDAGLLCLWARAFRPRTGGRKPLRLVAV